MTTSSLCLLCALAAVPPAGAGSLYVPTDPDQVLIRGQSPQVHSTLPWQTGDLGQASPWPTSVPRLASQNLSVDPFLDPGGLSTYGQSPGVYNRFGGPVGISGLNGPQPFRYGWKPRFDVGYLPKEEVSRGDGEFGIFEFDLELRNSRPLPNGSVLSYGPQLGLRTWERPRLVGGGELPATVYRLGSDYEWTTSAAGPWSFTLGFSPYLNTDFKGSVDTDAAFFDGRAMLFYRASAQWMYVIGVGYWDRVNDRIIPYSGVVWTPTDRTELRLMFPESRISHYIGNYFNDDKWVYASAGFHVEAYQIEIEAPAGDREEQIELSDWRAVVGLRSENDYLSSFIEGGIVFDRQVDFLRGTPDFDISSGFIIRGGLRF